MLIIYRVVRRARGTGTELSKHYNMTKPKLALQINTAATMDCEFSATRELDSPFYPPPYAADPFSDFPTGIVLQSPSANPAHMSSVQKLGIKRTVGP
jgi:hypothetical protein